MLLLAAPTMLSVNIPFAGFCESQWDREMDQELEQIVDNWRQDQYARERDLPALAGLSLDEGHWADLGHNLYDATCWGTARDHIAREYASEFAAWLCDTLGLDDLAYQYEEMVSPRYYNFETDRLFAKFSLTNLSTILAKLIDAEAKGDTTLIDAFKASFTSYDGFASFYDPEVPHKPIEEWDHNELRVLLGAWGKFNDVRNFDDLLYDYRCGGMYEEVGRAIDAAVDWQVLKVKAEQLAEELLEYIRATDPDYVQPTPRCTATLELPF